MKTNEIALQSQQLGEQTGARTADALSRQSAAWWQMPGIVTGFQESYARSQDIAFQAQRQHADMLHSASDLATDELRRKQAMEELSWAQQLHATDMLEMDKDLKRAQTRNAVAKLNQETDAIGKGEFGLDQPIMDRRHILALKAQGMNTGFRNGRPSVYKEPDQSVIDEAKRQQQEDLDFERSMLRQQRGSGVEAAKIHAEATVKAAELRTGNPKDHMATLARLRDSYSKELQKLREDIDKKKLRNEPVDPAMIARASALPRQIATIESTLANMHRQAAAGSGQSAEEKQAQLDNWMKQAMDALRQMRLEEGQGK